MFNFAETSGPSPLAKEKRMRILIVEDHTPTRLAMSRVMRQAGAEVTTARSTLMYC
jgi:PleD family two-component response regulator